MYQPLKLDLNIKGVNRSSKFFIVSIIVIEFRLIDYLHLLRLGIP